MLRNFFIITLRNFYQHKSFTAINLAGLTLGIACSLFILLWIQDETGTDRFHEQAARLYRVLINGQLGSKEVQTDTNIPFPLAAALQQDLPEIEKVVVYTHPQELMFGNGEQRFKESGIYAGREFFEVLTFPLLQGEATQVLSDPSYGAISETLAARLFGPDWQQQSILGKAIAIGQEASFTLTGVFEDTPGNSTLQFDYVLPVSRRIQERPWDENWGNFFYQGIVLLHAEADMQKLQQKAAPTLTRYHPYLQDNPGIRADVMFYPFGELHLYGKFENGQAMGGRIVYVRILSAVAVFILLLACINFMNLSTAKAARRAREIGVRKAIGASRRSLIRQFLGESLLLTLLSGLVALLLVSMFLPDYNAIIGKDLKLPYSDPAFWGMLTAILLLTALLAGLYPAFFLSAFKTSSIFRGSMQSGQSGAMLRRGLVLFQFVLSLLMIMATLAVHWQTRFLKNKHLGMDKEHVFYVSMEGIRSEQFDIVKQQLLQQEGIIGLTYVDQNPITIYTTTSDPNWEGMEQHDRASFRIQITDADFLSTMNIPLVQGRNFDPSRSSDTSTYIINETAARVMGMQDPVGKTLEFWNRKGQIIGVVRDFHLQSLHTAIAPLIICYYPADTWMALVKTEAGKTQQAIAGVSSLFEKYKPDYLFEYHFLDETYARLYENETTLGQLANAFALAAILIACLGLIGLVAYTTARRTKEIGIRKTLGASVSQILWLLSRDFMRLVIIALLIAIPIANYLLGEWLQDYAYRIPLSWWLFVLPGLLVSLLAWLVISSQSVRTARQNPVDALRYE